MPLLDWKVQDAPILPLGALLSLSLKSVLLSGESSTGISRDDYIGHVAKDIENKMPKVFDLDVVRKHLGAGISPTSVVLLQELERFNKLVVRMSRSLAELQRVSLLLKGRGLPQGSTQFPCLTALGCANRLWLEKLA